MAKKKSVAKPATKKKSVALKETKDVKVTKSIPEPVKEADLSKKKLPRKERIALMQKARRG